jgi:hypothetical protein
MSTASLKQINLINRLFTGVTNGVEALPEGDPAVIAVEALLASQQASLIKVLSNEDLDSRAASSLIDILFAAEKVLPPTEIRWVKEGDAWLLKGAVEALVPGTEVITTTRNGDKPAIVGTVVRTEGAVAFATVGCEAAVDAPEGVHINSDGQLITVKRTRSGQLVGFSADGEYLGKRGLRGLSATTVATSEQLAEANPAAALVARVNPDSDEVRLVLPTLSEDAANTVAFWVICTTGTVYRTVGGSGDEVVARATAASVVERAAALSDDDLRAAVVAYGVELGTCGSCGRVLTNDLSREQGIGPVCAKKGVFG